MTTTTYTVTTHYGDIVLRHLDPEAALNTILGNRGGVWEVRADTANGEGWWQAYIGIGTPYRSVQRSDLRPILGTQVFAVSHEAAVSQVAAFVTRNADRFTQGTMTIQTDADYDADQRRWAQEDAEEAGQAARP
jgi:hypothetical protein